MNSNIKVWSNGYFWAIYLVYNLKKALIIVWLLCMTVCHFINSFDASNGEEQRNDVDGDENTMIM
jgi:hypothetical protein